MGISKINLFSEEQNRLASISKALGHPARIAILDHLLKAKKCINSDLVKEIGLAQATISQHLKELKKAGIIDGNISGNSLCYCIHSENWKRIKSMYDHLFDSFSDENPKC